MTAAAKASLAAGMRILSLGRAERRLRRFMRRGMRAAVRFAVWQDLAAHAGREARAAVRLERPDLFALIAGTTLEAEAKKRMRDAELIDLVERRRRRLVQEWSAALTTGGWPRPEGRPPPNVFRVTAGTGKTHAAQAALLDAIAALPAGVPFRAAFLAPDHGLVDRHAATAREMLRERGMDVAVVSLAGRGHKRPEGTYLCKRWELAGEVAKKGLSVRRLVCGPASEGVEACPDCDYWKQGDGLPKRALIFATHLGKRADELPGGLWCPSAVIVDESPLAAMGCGEPIEVELDTLRNWRIWPNDDEFSEDRDEVTGIARDLCDLALDMDAQKVPRNTWREFLAGRGITPQRLRGAVEKASAMVNHLWREADRAARAHKKDAPLLAALKAPNGPPLRHKLARDVRDVLAAVLVDYQAGFSFLQSVTFPPKEKDGPVTRAFVHRAHPLVDIAGGRMTEQRAIIALDATAHRLLIPFIWGRDARMVRIDAERHEVAIWVPDALTSHTALGVNDNEDTPRRKREAHEVNRTTLRAALLNGVAACGSRNLTVVLPKGARHIAESVPGIGPVFHFGATRGRNDAEHCTDIAVVGRKQPSAKDVENIARALVHGHGVELTMPCDYTEPATPIRMRDGTMREGVDGWKGAPNHADPYVQAVLETERECEVEQAADRIRSVRADSAQSKCVTIYGPVSGNRPIDLIVPCRLQSVLAAAAADPAFRDGRPVPITHGPWLAAKVPDLLPGHSARGADAQRQAEGHLGARVTVEIAALCAGAGERWSHTLDRILTVRDQRSALCAVTLKGREGVKWLVARDADAFSDAAISQALDGAAIAEKHIVTADDLGREATAVVGLRTYPQFLADMRPALERLALPPMAGGLVAWRLAPADLFDEYLSDWESVAHAVVGEPDRDCFGRMAGHIAASSGWTANVEDVRAAGIALLAYGILAHCAPLMFRDADARLGVTASVALGAIPAIRRAIMELACALRTVMVDEDPAIVMLAIHASKVAAAAALVTRQWERMAWGSSQGATAGRAARLSRLVAVAA